MRARRAFLSWVLPVAAALPALVSGCLAVRGHWSPVIDNSVIAVRTHDVFSTHPPLVGIYQSLTTIAHSNTRLHHLGPLGFWLLAPTLLLGGSSGAGLVAGASVLNGLAAAFSVRIAGRTGGVAGAFVVAAAVAALSWALGGQVLHDPWNPHLAIFAFVLFLVAAWAVGAGDVRLLPWLVIVASIVVQLHLTYLIPVAFVTVSAIAGAVLASRTRGREDLRRTLWLSALGAVVCWSGPLVDEIGGSHNATKVVDAAARANYEKVGAGIAWRDLVHATSLPPEWVHPFTSVVKPDRAPGAAAVVTSILVLSCLAAATLWSWRKSHRGAVSLCGVAIAAVLGAFVSTTSAPVEYDYTTFLYPRRIWWVTGVLVWIALAYTASAAVRPLLQRRRSSWTEAGVALGVVVVIVALVAAWPRLGPADDYGSAGFGAVRTLVPRTAPAVRDGTWLMRTDGELATSVVGPGVAAGLVLRGRSVVVADANFPDFGHAHVVHRDTVLAGTVFVVSGNAAATVPAGYREVARWDPATQPTRYRSYHQTLLLVPVSPVAVFVSESATR